MKESAAGELTYLGRRDADDSSECLDGDAQEVEFAGDRGNCAARLCTAVVLDHGS